MVAMSTEPPDDPAGASPAPPPFNALDPNEVYQRLVKLGEDWADAEAAADLLEETRKSVLARLTLERMTGDTRTRVTAEQSALTTLEYRSHLEAMVTARQKATRLRVRYDAARTWSDLLRTMQATRRVEMQLSGLS